MGAALESKAVGTFLDKLLKRDPTAHTRDGSKRLGAIPGHGFSGIESVGSEVKFDQIGREIYGMNDWLVEGASAEYCISTPGSVAASLSG
jgi:NADPH:quinone reductase-like Zn-dependent oxidoreductase